MGLGACYHFEVAGIRKPLVLQSINTGGDVDGNQFDLQEGDGGAGAFNTCAGSSTSMYPGTYAAWGDVYGGVHHKSDCKGLPMYPKEDGPMKQAGDSLVELCEISFDEKLRIDEPGANSNPSINSVARVKCPDQLVELTQIQRSDDPSYYSPPLSAKRVADHVCGAGSGSAWCLTRMMDCRKPSGAIPDNVKSKNMVHGKKLVQACTADGYTRIDNQCGCFDCWC